MPTATATTFAGRRLVIATALAVATALSACVAVPVGYAPRGFDGAAVLIEPPPPRVEVIGVAPAAGYFWIGGHWGWGGNAHVWSPGRWAAARPGSSWVPHHWMRDGRYWREARGHWSR